MADSKRQKIRRVKKKQSKRFNSKDVLGDETTVGDKVADKGSTQHMQQQQQLQQYHCTHRYQEKTQKKQTDNNNKKCRENETKGKKLNNKQALYYI